VAVRPLVPAELARGDATALLATCNPVEWAAGAAQRGRASFGSGVGGDGFPAAGGMRGGDGRFRGGSGQRSDVRLKREIAPLGRCDNRPGSIASSMTTATNLCGRPGTRGADGRAVAVVGRRDGYLRVYDRLGLRFEP
jgi:hypothetical protein